MKRKYLLTIHLLDKLVIFAKMDTLKKKQKFIFKNSSVLILLVDE